MSTQVDRLHGLLDRVQHNRARRQPRIDETVEFGTPVRAAPKPQPAPEPAPESVTMPGHSSPVAPPPERVEPRTPMELAVEQSASAGASEVTGQPIAAPKPMKPSRPIAEVATPHQPTAFLDLLGRSLGLRPR